MKTCALCPKPIAIRRKYCPTCARKTRATNNVAATKRARERQKATRGPTRKACAYKDCNTPFVLAHPAQRYCTGLCRTARIRQANNERVRRKTLTRVMARHGWESP